MKEDILPSYAQAAEVKPAPKSQKKKFVFGMLTGALALLTFSYPPSIPQYKLFQADETFKYCPHKTAKIAEGLCPILEKIPGDTKAYEYFRTEEYRNKSISALIDIANVPSESFDRMAPVGQDPRWDVFYKLEKVIEKKFPKVFEKLQVDKVNEHGLIFTWEGTNKELKPTLLTAHQDVVPVLPASRKLWDHDPYDAYFDGEYIWGRGVSDDKSSLVGILEAVDTLLKDEFIPERTLVVALGFDEEVSGYNGAGRISEFLLEKYGPDSFESLVDEGGQGVFERDGVKLAVPGIGEKGYIDSLVTLKTPGGHSSVPPDHTAIGIVGKLITQIESNPFEPLLTAQNPFFGFLQCLAVHSPTIDPAYKAAILHADTNRLANKIVKDSISKNRFTRYNIQTSQALDLINGGLKINALPEEVSLAVNFRVATESSVEETREKLIQDVKIVALDHGLGVSLNTTDDGVVEILPSTAAGYFIVSDYAKFIQPAPVTSTDTEAWTKLAGTIREVFEEFGGEIKGTTSDVEDKTPVVVAPSLMTANTDTKHYWNLTKNIFRFSPSRNTGVSGNIHTVNENIAYQVYLEGIVFYYNYIKNASN